MKKTAVTIIFIFLISCTTFNPVSLPNIQYYQLGAIDDIKVTQNCKVDNNLPSIQITTMKSYTPYNTKNMIYSPDNYELSEYQLNKWVATPEQMLTTYIQQNLYLSCQYSQVVNSDFFTINKYRLVTQLLKLKQTTTKEQGEVSLMIFVQLINNETNQVIGSRVFNEKDIGNADATSYVLIANKLAHNFIEELKLWLKSINHK